MWLGWLFSGNCPQVQVQEDHGMPHDALILLLRQLHTQVYVT